LNEDRDNKEAASAATDAIGPKELRFMNSRARELLLRYWDFPVFESLLRKHEMTLENGSVLDVGCGSGYTTLLIRERFNPRRLDAFDIVEGQVELARSRGLDANIFVADITKPNLPERSYDAVFVCGVLHHCPEWRTGLARIATLLRAGGVLLLEEPGSRHIKLETMLMGRPPADGAWTGLEPFKSEVGSVGLSIVEERSLYFGLFGSFLCVKMANAVNGDYFIARNLLRGPASRLAEGQEAPA
jgi:SAM-dependent methyltransferase